jgi:hypothetical protein
MGVKRQFATIFQLYHGSRFHLLVEESVVFSLTNFATCGYIEYTTTPENEKGSNSQTWEVNVLTEIYYLKTIFSFMWRHN